MLTLNINPIFPIRVLSIDRTLIINLLSFQLATRLNSQNTYKYVIQNEIWHINLYMNIGKSNWHNWSNTPRNWSFRFYISPLYDYWFPSTWKSLAHISWGEMERCEKRAFQLLKIRKKEISWNIKTKCVTGFYWQRCLRVWRIILIITGWAHQRKTFTIFSIKIMRILKLFFTRNRVFKQKEVVSNLHIFSNGLEKMWASYIFNFSTRILTSTHTNISNIFSQNICRDV